MHQPRTWILTCALLSLSCATVPTPTAALADHVAALRNDDISWDGTWIGLWPRLSDRAARIEAFGDAAIPLLKSALENEDQYVAAHVLLTCLTGEPFCPSGGKYNGLAVALYADGRTVIHDQRASIRQRWNQPHRNADCESEGMAPSTR